MPFNFDAGQIIVSERRQSMPQFILRNVANHARYVTQHVVADKRLPHIGTLVSWSLVHPFGGPHVILTRRDGIPPPTQTLRKERESTPRYAWNSPS
ncbi:hypothetical protein [Methylovirgula sp. 4M-Z18]|uniref:hypothetical protein n=1 Tax=Methylovirgula sp. 4M-Z18 TaxID=2293567 RepID=UPI0011C02147|nr:hypothetical protein [Methylovirgula sp. 4M-Z18]